jgi:hypothetical protein
MAAAQALLGEDASGLPLVPVKHHEECLTTLKARYYEFGAALTHAVSARSV